MLAGGVQQNLKLSKRGPKSGLWALLYNRVNVAPFETKSGGAFQVISVVSQLAVLSQAVIIMQSVCPAQML
jgi:hypothetical protein